MHNYNKGTTSNPAYTSYKRVTPEVALRYHRGVLFYTSNKDSGTVEKYMRTIKKPGL